MNRQKWSKPVVNEYIVKQCVCVFFPAPQNHVQLHSLLKKSRTVTLRFLRLSRYHDMPDVIDFLVLRQCYDDARNRVWQPSKY